MAESGKLIHFASMNPEVGAEPSAGAVISPVTPGSLNKALGPGEVSLSREFVCLYKHGWRFDHDVGRWYNWDGRRWTRDDLRRASHLIGELLNDSGDGKPSVERASVARGVEFFAGSNPSIAVSHDIWDANTLLVGTPGGTIDLPSGQLRKPCATDYITMQTSVTPTESEPILWLKFLVEAVNGDQKMVDFLQQWCGYCLTGQTTEHALAFVYGPGGNGKSVFLNTIAAIMGDYAITAAMDTFTASKHDRHSTELAMLRGARLVTANETEEGRAWAEARLKQITGGDPITARFMRQDNFTFRPQFKLMIAGNHAPALRNVDDAMKRRLNFIPFVVKPQSPDPDLEAKLIAEHGKILNWMIKGCLAWQHSGLTRPAAVSAATEEYFSNQDLVSQWIEDCCEIDPTKWELPTKLFQSWSTYAKEAGENPGSIKGLKPRLAHRNFYQFKTGGQRVYRGLALVNG